MSTHNEIEFKQLLSQSQYNSIYDKYFQSQTPFVQTNYYIETTDFTLREHHSALRIREHEDQYEMTLKVPAEVGLTEYNHDIDLVPQIDQTIQSDDLPEDILEQLKAMDVDLSDLTVLGSLTTERMERKLGDNLLVLDKSSYLDCVDYELEFEVEDHDQGKQQFDEILKEFGMTHEKPNNKVQRFFTRKSELNHRH
ncbi:uncharacterized protein YjbK [Staphylococcus auricularis]|uniref:CYTH domain-containing protein n=1 Tax=Staphylococcus auricularis TaxID=29379 RepID=A0AAP8PNA5_9STAP|nr:CYTH domain-containing protein [Staphylococcus auricularis]MBM0868808.1 CYTH domain-containing protein [Staphylococcus auricularis]MCG7341477.1 CYTH domain-containing protein [Staphylococcus auricularis]MDC6326310.1 CYTH domain-containing protein [Staphylococcus auricularis]MDN4533801.1 CYTH domain-containing protein [Staphylococcus auricularis]PNZ66690.1 CYTH domain-containing protein [Staphylococcus auricularis]